MKKRLLLVLAVPALLLTACGGNGGVNVKGTVDNGREITSEEKQAITNVEEAKKETAETVAKRGVNVKSRSLTLQKTTSSYSGQSVTTENKQDLNFDIEIGIETPSVSVKTNGSQYYAAAGQSATGNIEGLSDATKASGAWVINNDYQKISMAGQESRQDDVLFQGSTQTVEGYYRSCIEGLYSWDFDFDFAKAKSAASQYGIGDLLDKIVVGGTPSTGTFEVGLSEAYNVSMVGGTLKFYKLRYSYKDNLLQEYAIGFEASSASSEYNYSTTVQLEMDFSISYK